jgi:hypothetical protein
MFVGKARAYLKGVSFGEVTDLPVKSVLSLPTRPGANTPAYFKKL